MSDETTPAATERKERRDYWIEVVAFTIIGAALWSCGGMVAGTGLIFDVHEWGMFWFGAIVLVLPVVAVIALVLASVTPGIAARRGAGRPLFYGRLVVLLWLLGAFLITLFSFYLLSR